MSDDTSVADTIAARFLGEGKGFEPLRLPKASVLEPVTFDEMKALAIEAQHGWNDALLQVEHLKLQNLGLRTQLARRLRFPYIRFAACCAVSFLCGAGLMIFSNFLAILMS